MLSASSQTGCHLMIRSFLFIADRCRDQLHVVLAMSPIGDTFRSRLRKFPSLVNCCTIDWFQVNILYDLLLDIGCLDPSSLLCKSLLNFHFDTLFKSFYQETVQVFAYGFSETV